MQYQQRGAALVMVLVLLASALMVGIMGGQTGLVGERLGSNYRVLTLAQMRAEVAALRAIEQFAALEWHDAPLISDRLAVRWEEYSAHPLATLVDEGCSQKACLFIPVERDGQQWAMAIGAVIQPEPNGGTLLAQSLPIFVRFEKMNESATGTKATVIWH
ncbi:pilus assembly PilX family protein [Vreelandella olivaria]|uniref:pilus assembly PilX family protein n=1 Tax=Vreelandella olivaria TaxID=390919 RepID=UPI00201F31EF|nr:hypothetical protein [Halomonas olivaria]